MLLPLTDPFETSFGRQEVKEAVLVTLTADGSVGYGECVAGAGPWYSSETLDTAWSVLQEYLIPSLLGRALEAPDELRALLSPIRGHPMAKAALDEALWDVYARSLETPLWRLLGGVRDRIPVGVSVGIQRDQAILHSKVAAFLDEGYRRVKVKIKPGWDLDVLSGLRRRFGDVPLSVDANAAYSLKDKELIGELDALDLMMIEQPLGYDDLIDHAELQGGLKTPVCLDESITGLGRTREALALGSCRIVNLKKGRVGGIAEAKAIHDFCQERGVPVWAGGMLEMGIGRAHNVHLASLPNFTLPGDISATDRYFAQDLIEPPFVLGRDGTLPVPQGPGIGVEVVPERVEGATKKLASFKA